jgi:hypothetical protein
MGNLHVVEDHAILELARVAENDSIPDNDIFSDVTARSELASFPNPGRTFDRHAWLNYSAGTHEYVVADE